MRCYSEPTGKSYDTIEELEAAEANGFVVVGVSDRENERPWCVGPFDTKVEARKVAVKMRRKIKRLDQDKPPAKTKVTVRHLWKEI